MAVNLPKNNIEPHQNFTDCYKKHGGSGLIPRHTKFWQKLAEDHYFKLKN